MFVINKKNYKLNILNQGKMAASLWIMIAIFVLLLILAVVALYVVKKNKRPTDYYMFFIMGMIWAPFGLIMDNIPFTVMGLVFMGIGWGNRDKWKKNRVTWKKMNKEEHKLHLFIMAMVGVLVLAGIVILLLTKNNVI